jgi:hypothetical protein
LKRASSRTKSSKRRLAAVNSRNANQANALDDGAQERQMREIAARGKSLDEIGHWRFRKKK